MTQTRSAGLLLPASALPATGPIGSLDGAPDFVDWLVSAGFSLWQLLPLGPTDAHGSPYSSWSAWAGNPDLLGLDWLEAKGLLQALSLPSPDRVDYGEALQAKRRLILQAAKRLLELPSHPMHGAYLTWRRNCGWVEEAALFRALKGAHGEAPWWNWPSSLRSREPAALMGARHDHGEALDIWAAALFLFEAQWSEIRGYAAQQGLSLVGDLPIYVAWDSVDVWCQPDLFQLDDAGVPPEVAGVPPDGFSDLGQRWGNPLFDWPVHAANGFAWWRQRVNRNLELYDRVRIDHFIGFSRYYAIPFEAEDARQGRWREGPGAALFEALQADLGTLPFWAEDLGDVDAGTLALRDDFELPGMAVLQFGMNGEADNPHTPANHRQHSVVYTGTHDNDTSRGWWEELGEESRRQLGLGENPVQATAALVDLAFESAADVAVIPAQDLLALGSEARMNIPGTIEGNWCWRLGAGQLSPALGQACRLRLERSGRLRASSLQALSGTPPHWDT